MKAWHLPAATYALNAAYNLNSKWIFSLGVDGMSKRYSKQINNSGITELKGFADLNTRVDYVLNGVVRFWVQGSNLINQRYEVWQGYNSYRLTILGGLAASF